MVEEPQPSLNFDGRDAIRERFERFHRENPWVYEELVRLARELKRKGRSRYSLDSLFHVVRWHRAQRSVSEEPFPLNDHFTSRYARLIMEREPDLIGFFECRTLRTN